MKPKSPFNLSTTSQQISTIAKGGDRPADYLTRLVAPGQVIVSREDLEKAKAESIRTENRLKTALGTMSAVYLFSAPAAALQAHRRGAATGATIAAGLLGPLYLIGAAFREGLDR
jgi:hypothetical protein